jgi:hypothetical protein
MYANLGGYDYANYIITKKDDASLYTTSSFEATVRYLDPRMETKEIEKAIAKTCLLGIIGHIFVSHGFAYRGKNCNKQ